MAAPTVDTSHQLSARRQGEILGAQLTNAHHAALCESRPWYVSPSLVCSYADDAECVIDSKHARHFTNIALLLHGADLIGSTWSGVQLSVYYIPARINVVVAALVARFNGSVVRVMQTIGFRSEHRRWTVRRETILVFDELPSIRRENGVLDCGIGAEQVSKNENDTVQVELDAVGSAV